LVFKDSSQDSKYDLVLSKSLDSWLQSSINSPKKSCIRSF
jgi:hypothetical protein